MDMVSATHLTLLGLILAGATPAIIAAMKKWVKKAPALSAFMPVVITAGGWLIDSLIMGMNPFGDAGLTVLLTALVGSLGGAKARDVWKHTMKEAA